MKSGEGVEFAAREEAIARDGGAVVDGAGAEIDPEIAVLGGPEGAGAAGEGGGGVAVGIGVGVGFGLGAEVE